MVEHRAIADLLVELGELRGKYKTLTWSYFELRQAHLAESPWWTRSGAGTPHELSNRLRETLADGRSQLADYWYFPSGKHNPYLDLLYCEMPAHGFSARELPAFDQLASLPSGSVVHLHWTESLRPNGHNEKKNQASLDRARQHVEDFIADPANTLVWSVHEPLPHGSRWPDQDAAFHQFLSDSAHIVHVLHSSTAEACAAYFTIDPAKTICAELPLYTGVYSNYRTRESARALLGVAPDELCVAFFGAIRAYKGLQQLLTATDHVAKERSLRLLIAGMPVGDIESLTHEVDHQEEATMAPLLVPDAEIQTLLGAADVLIVPYERFLNSAVLMLGLSFGVPVVATNNPVTAQAERSGMVTTYNTTDELSAALSVATINPQVELSAAFEDEHRPQTIGAVFASAVTARLRYP